ncbi:hypothetical protein SBADM41S_12353 [Streptomyces badius]
MNAGPPATATTGFSAPGPGAYAGSHGSSASAGAVRASASSASRSHPARTRSPMARTASTASLCRSATGTRPRCREGVATCGARRITPSTGSPDSSSASRNSASCRSDATLFRITPPIRTSGSHEANPWTRAATDRDCEEASTTSTTGAFSSLATCAVDASSPCPEAPSYSPITPSTTARSHPADPCAKSGATRSVPHMYASRFRPGRPVAREW